MAYARAISVVAIFACLPASLMCDQPSNEGGEASTPFDCFGTPCDLTPSFGNDTCCLVDGGGTCQESKDAPGCNALYCGPQIRVDPDASDLASDSGPCIRTSYIFSCMSNAACKNGQVCCMSNVAFEVNVACEPGPCDGYEHYALCDTAADCPVGHGCAPVALQGTTMPFKVCTFELLDASSDAATDSALE